MPAESNLLALWLSTGTPCRHSALSLRLRSCDSRGLATLAETESRRAFPGVRVAGTLAKGPAAPNVEDPRAWGRLRASGGRGEHVRIGGSQGDPLGIMALDPNTYRYSWTAPTGGSF